jgi:hypothetical protein
VLPSLFNFIHSDTIMASSQIYDTSRHTLTSGVPDFSLRIPLERFQKSFQLDERQQYLRLDVKKPHSRSKGERMSTWRSVFAAGWSLPTVESYSPMRIEHWRHPCDKMPSFLVARGSSDDSSSRP